MFKNAGHQFWWMQNRLHIYRGQSIIRESQKSNHFGNLAKGDKEKKRSVPGNGGWQENRMMQAGARWLKSLARFHSYNISSLEKVIKLTPVYHGLVSEMNLRKKKEK